jgi:hypothetical protein
VRWRPAIPGFFVHYTYYSLDRLADGTFADGILALDRLADGIFLLPNKVLGGHLRAYRDSAHRQRVCLSKRHVDGWPQPGRIRPGFVLALTQVADIVM